MCLSVRTLSADPSETVLNYDSIAGPQSQAAPTESGFDMRRGGFFLVMLIAGLTVRPVTAQSTAAASADVEQLVRAGDVEALEARLRGGRNADEKHDLARAYANRARQMPPGDTRARLAEQAADKYRKWIETLEIAARGGEPAETVRLAAARVEYAGVLLATQAAAGLDDYELTLGQRGERAQLTRVLATVQEACEQAMATLAPLTEKLGSLEEDLLSAGVYDLLGQARLDLSLHLGWTQYYLGRLETADEARRRELLSKTQRGFQELLDGDLEGALWAQCIIGLGVAQRELGRLSEAEKTLRTALSADAPAAFAARARYELARCQLAAGHFDAGRSTLQPLVEKDADALSAAEQPARFYVNLAHVWDAYSFLLEATALQAGGRADAERVRQVRASGLTRFRKLAQRGGPWPALVQIYIAAGIGAQTPVRELSTTELLYTGRALLEARDYSAAAERLQAAADRHDADPQLAGDVLFELARCRLGQQDERAAAQTFQRLATEFRGHARAAEAATQAVRLWGLLAERTQARADYLQLAATLRNLLESFADHPQREEAVWLLPVALQLAGDFAPAAAAFAKIPRSSPRWEEAQYRRAWCGRRAVEARRTALDEQTYRTEARRAADALLRYAQEAHARGAPRDGNAAARTWSAEACLAGAELLASPGVEEFRAALTAVEEFETRYPDNKLLGRLLALRIRAHRGLREFNQAAGLVARFLENAAAEQVGGTLAGLAADMQAEVQRLAEDGQAEAARRLAQDALGTFEELERQVRADPARAPHLEAVQAGRAHLCYLAGQYDEAQRLVAALLERSPRSGNYQRLHALICSAQLSDAAPSDAVRAAQEAWAVLLADSGLGGRTPRLYWEARYHWLALALRLGQAADVAQAIAQEEVWCPDLGGSPWREKLTALRDEARRSEAR